MRSMNNIPLALFAVHSNVHDVSVNTAYEIEIVIGPVLALPGPGSLDVYS